MFGWGGRVSLLSEESFEPSLDDKPLSSLDKSHTRLLTKHYTVVTH